MKWYARYMDDSVFLHQSKEFLSMCLDYYRKALAMIGFEINEKKTTIRKITQDIAWLGFNFRLTKTGKVLIFAIPSKIKHEKKKIKRMVALVRKGKMEKWRNGESINTLRLLKFRYGMVTQLV